MLANRASLTVLALAAVLLAGCTSPGESPGADLDRRSDPSAEATPAGPTAVASVQPKPLIDLDCSDFAGVASMGTIAGVTERDPRGAFNDSLDVVSVADVVRNAGGIACEFSDGGSWRNWQSDDFSLNEGWRGAAIFVVPNAAAASDADFTYLSSCGDATTSIRSVCSNYFASGDTVINLVLSWNDRGPTFIAIRDHVLAVVAGAASTAGPISRPTGTFEPPHDCGTLIPLATASTILGAPGAAGGRATEVGLAAEATYLTENIGCEWWVDGQPLAVEVLVYPGGEWAAELTLPELDTTLVELAGARDGDTAVKHCEDVSEWGFWLCTIEVIADGTWIHATGNANSESEATAIGIRAAEATLAHRD
jgi:hypothetical protein